MIKYICMVGSEMLKNYIRNFKLPDHNQNEFKLANLVHHDSMPHRCSMVINNNGYGINY